jgi:hypothetical protein
MFVQEEHEKKYALTPESEKRLSWALIAHDPVFIDEAEAARLLKLSQDTGDNREFHRMLARAVGKFIEYHKQSGHSCVEGLSAEELVLAMTLLQLNYQLRAGDVDEEGMPTN